LYARYGFGRSGCLADHFAPLLTNRRLSGRWQMM
jgi:hypothetical protein